MFSVYWPICGSVGVIHLSSTLPWSTAMRSSAMQEIYRMVMHSITTDTEYYEEQRSWLFSLLFFYFIFKCNGIFFLTTWTRNVRTSSINSYFFHSHTILKISMKSVFFTQTKHSLTLSAFIFGIRHLSTNKNIFYRMSLVFAG